MHKQKAIWFTVGVIMLALAFTFAPYATQAQTADSESIFSLEALGNATYLSDFAETGQVTLQDGQFVDEANHLWVTLTGYAAFGDLNADEHDDAVAVLVTNSGGTGEFYDLALVVDQENQLTNVATARLGDRVQIYDLAIADGQLVVDMATLGPDDAVCCPTLDVQQIYAVEDDALTLVSSTETGTEEPAGVFSPDADPTAAMLFLGGEEYYWLDPTLVSVHSGAVTGPGVKASELGAGCVGAIDERPDVVLNWTEDPSVALLRIFFLSMSDPSMVVVTPTGDVVCNDDLNPLVLDPYLEFENPAPGRYAIFIGSFENDATTPGFLVVTSEDFSPATMDIAQMFPRQTNPGAIGEPLPIDVLNLDAEPLAGAPAAPLTAETAPYTETLVAGGDLGAYNIELDNNLCTGFIDATPTFAFDWKGKADKLVLFFEGEADSTLIVRDPNGVFQCNDDFDGADNLNPYLDLTPMDGSYQLWIGSFAPSTMVTGTLTIAGDTDVQPVPLTADDTLE